MYEDDQKVYLVMDYIQGETLLDHIWHQKHLPERESIKIASNLLN
jgi:serine/threonine protein kinase